MDNIFFILSKLIWPLIMPENLIVLALIITSILLILKKDKLAKKWLLSTSSIVLIITVLPIGAWLTYPLETHFPTKPILPKQVDGIILLGGSFIPSTSQAWDKVQTNDYSDRIYNFLALMQQYPKAKAIFTGGQASINGQYPSEAYFAKQLFDSLGIESNRIIYDDKARNTYENIINTKKLAQAKPKENWVVVTTAYHLPRTIGLFCQQNWPVIPYPADFHTNPNELFSATFDFSGNLQQLNEAIHEWVGLMAYYLTGKTPQWLPNQCP